MEMLLAVNHDVAPCFNLDGALFHIPLPHPHPRVDYAVLSYMVWPSAFCLFSLFSLFSFTSILLSFYSSNDLFLWDSVSFTTALNSFLGFPVCSFDSLERFTEGFEGLRHNRDVWLVFLSWEWWWYRCQSTSVPLDAGACPLSDRSGRKQQSRQLAGQISRLRCLLTE